MTPRLPDCRACGRDALALVLSLGRTPLANALLTREQLNEPEPRYALDLAFCRACSLVQITETVPPAELFREYSYFSSVSETMVRHAETLVERVIRERQLCARSLVVELGSNDGYLLQFYRRRGIPVLGIDPAENVAREASARGIPTIAEFFGLDLARRLNQEGKRADVIHAHNVLAHVADLNGVVEGIASILAPAGTAIVEVPYLKDLLDRCEFDTIYHEHLCYFSLTALDRLVRRHGLRVRDVERVPIHGGSLRLWLGSEGAAVEPEVSRLLAEEQASGLDQLATYASFGGRVEALKVALGETLRQLKRGGHRLAAYGAAAKGSTLLNYVGIGKETLDYVVDRSPHKQGRFMPGVHLPISPTERLLEDMPDDVLLLTWNFADEIFEQQKAYRARGGRFIIPVPEVKVA